MAVMRVKFLATSIMMQMHLSVFLPEAVLCGQDSGASEDMQVLWLLHGEGGDCSDWLRLSLIEHYAQKYNMALIMPNLDNAMCMNMAHGAYPYFTYLTEELPSHIRSLLPILPLEKNRNYVAGVSTGGTGAVKWMLQKPEMFAGGACLSGELDLVQALQQKEAMGALSDDWAAAFGSAEFIKGTENDLVYLCEKSAAQGSQLPKVYLADAQEDASCARNQTVVPLLRKLGMQINHVQEPGKGGWPFWDRQIGIYMASICENGGRNTNVQS